MDMEFDDKKQWTKTVKMKRIDFESAFRDSLKSDPTVVNSDRGTRKAYK